MDYLTILSHTVSYKETDGVTNLSSHSGPGETACRQLWSSSRSPGTERETERVDKGREQGKEKSDVEVNSEV